MELMVKIVAATVEVAKIRSVNDGKDYLKRSRPYPVEGYKQEGWDDERVQISVTLERKDHLAICRDLPSRKMNRNEWIREAVKEKLQRENNGV